MSVCLSGADMQLALLIRFLCFARSRLLRPLQRLSAMLSVRCLIRLSEKSFFCSVRQLDRLAWGQLSMHRS